MSVQTAINRNVIKVKFNIEYFRDDITCLTEKNREVITV